MLCKSTSGRNKTIRKDGADPPRRQECFAATGSAEGSCEHWNNPLLQQNAESMQLEDCHQQQDHWRHHGLLLQPDFQICPFEAVELNSQDPTLVHSLTVATPTRTFPHVCHNTQLSHLQLRYSHPTFIYHYHNITQHPEDFFHAMHTTEYFQTYAITSHRQDKTCISLCIISQVFAIPEHCR